MNRFSKDIGNMDDHLPIFFIWTVLVCVLLSNNCTQKTFMFLIFFQFFSYFGGVIFLATVAIPWVLIALVVFVIIFLIVRWLFLTTARELKRLEALCEYCSNLSHLVFVTIVCVVVFPTACSPIFSHLSTTLQGLSVIRSYSMQSVAMEQLHNYQNRNTQAWYLYFATVRYNSQINTCMKTVT